MAPLAMLGAGVGAFSGCASAPSSYDHPLLIAPAPGATACADAIDPARVRMDVDALAAFGTRHTMSDVVSEDRGIGAARRWVRAEFERRTRADWRTGETEVVASFDSHMIPPDGRRITREVEVVNVLCTIPGTMPEARGRLYYVLAHLDSRASGANDATSDSPGANDDASGVGVLLALAEAIAAEGLESTVVLMATSGEEQGLYGARAHARALRSEGADVRAVLNNDTVGDPTGPDGRDGNGFVRIFSQGMEARWFAQDDRLSGEVRLRELRKVRTFGHESDSASRQLARFIHEVGYREDTPIKPALVFRQDRFLRGGDHTAFDEVGYPSVRFCELFEDYNRQHQDVRVEGGVQFGDLPEYVDEQYVAGVAALNATVLTHLANAPSGPPNARMIVAGLDNNTTLRWDACPEPDVAGYEVVYRWTTEAQWSGVIDAGLDLEARVDLSKDNWLFGVRSYDHDGYRSPVVMPVVASE